MKQSHKGAKGRNVLFSVITGTVKKRKLLTAALLLAVAGSILSALLPPLVLERIVNQLVAQREVTVRLALLYFLILAMSGLFDAGKEMLITIFGQKITHGLRSELCRKLSRLPAEYFTKNEPGAVTARFVGDVDTVETLFTGGIIGMFTDVCKVVSIIAVIFVKSRGLGILLVITAPLLFFLTRAFQKRMLSAQKANRAAMSRINAHIPETIANIRTVHCLKKESYLEQQYDNRIGESYRAVERSNLYDSVYSPIIIFISTVLIAAVMILSALGGRMQTFFGMSVGTAVAVFAYVSRVFSPIESIGMEIQSIQSAVAGVSRISALLAAEEQPLTDRQITDAVLREGKCEGIRFEQVGFSYEAGQTVLENLNFSVADGESVTLAGRTGIGKSTIFKLLLGIYQPQNGTVSVFGQRADLIPSAGKRGLFGYVPQTFHRVPGTVAEQITLFDSAVSQQAVEQAATLVGLHETITALPQGYATDCGNAGFSQGQLQLLSIARAVAADPPIMLLDEITANLDSMTEQTVLAALHRAAVGRIVISVSHRLYETGGGRLIQIT